MSNNYKETTLLKGMVKWPDKLIPLVRELKLESRDFILSDGHKFLFQGILSLYFDGLTINEENLKRLLENEKWENRNKLSYCEKIIDELFDDEEEIFNKEVIDFKKIISEMIDASFKRGSLEILRESLFKIKNGEDDISRLIKRHIEKLKELEERRRIYVHGIIDDDLEYLKGMNLRDEKKLLGIDSGFPLLNEKISGFENQLYAIGGGTGMGKTTFVTQLAFQVLNCDENSRIIFFALDQSRRDILVKFISEVSALPIDYVRNPNKENRLFYTSRMAAIEKIAKYSSRIQIVDESTGRIGINEVENEVRKLRLTSSEKLLIIVDTVSGISNENGLDNTLKRLKSICRQEEASVIFTYNLGYEAEIGRPTRLDVAKLGSLFYEPYCSMTIYCDYIVDKETPFIEWEWGTQDMMVPIIEFNIVKNKMGEFSGKLFYRYLNSLASFRECVPVEVDNYNSMIKNIEDNEENRKENKSLNIN